MTTLNEMRSVISNPAKKRRRRTNGKMDGRLPSFFTASPALQTMGVILVLSCASSASPASQSLRQLAFVSSRQCRSGGGRCMTVREREPQQMGTRFSPVYRKSPFAMKASNNNNDHDDDDFKSNESHQPNDDDDDEGYDDIQSRLNKISWLPSVKLGKQPVAYSKSSRVESASGEGYASLQGRNTPPGYNNVEILPVLPLSMVSGLESLFADDEDAQEESSYGSGVWEVESSSVLVADGDDSTMFSGTSGYLPHTKGHVLTVAEPRYKKLYDDLLQMGSYYGTKREGAIRRAKERGDDMDKVLLSSNLPDPDEKRRFIVTVTNPKEDGVFAEYGVLFQLRDLDEVAAIASYEDDLSVEELNELMDPREFGYEDSISEDFMDVLLETHYEATHDVVGRVKIHRFVNPECWQDGPDGEEYLMAEATVFDLIENVHAKTKVAQREEKETVAKRLEEHVKQEAIGNVAEAVSRIREELLSAVDDAFVKQQQQRLTTKPDFSNKQAEKKTSNANFASPSLPKKQIPLVPKGILVERRADGSFLQEERDLRESFAQLVSLQQELREKFRFTRESVKSFGIGSVGMWLSAAAWSKFVEKRLEAANGDMQSELQAKLVEYLTGRNERNEDQVVKTGNEKQDGDEAYEGEPDSIDFDDLSPELQHEFQLVQARATEELGPVAFERAIQMQRIIQAENYLERLNLLRECVEGERRRLEAKKMLRLAFSSHNSLGEGSRESPRLTRKEAMIVFEKLMRKDQTDDDGSKFQEDAFQ
ncbi:hypothetical protein HJC23_010637 [Cyclotella cryptica]|uniref:Uncharacterized protein n=1 Tax=Cyclotella cryptica TaxID=29204 RepID=A0ABD3PKY0_9STRA|eukprot:CCRYP_014832-RA/>CCRYP_014832-RA protein AED:0.17 eAED:0.17 QI:0/-1/0/1/-1/1/1/0/763